MNDDFDIVGFRVKYIGSKRPALRNLIGTVEKVGENGSAGVRYPGDLASEYTGKDGLVWASRWAWLKLKTDIENAKLAAAAPENEDDIFLNAAGGPREVIMHEIERLTARLADLKKAVEVIDSL